MTSDSNNRFHSVLPWIFLALLTALSVAAAADLFDNPGSLLSANYLFGNDLPTYQSQGEMLRRMWSSDTRFWGYNPYFMAGYPMVKLYNGLIWGIVSALLYWMPIGSCAAVFMLGVAGLSPLFYYAATAQVNVSTGWRLVGATLGAGAFFLGPNFFLWWMGAIEGALSSLLVVLTWALYLKWCESGTVKLWAAFTAGASMTLMTHHMGALCFGTLVLVSLPFVRLDLKKWIWLSAAGAISLVVNSFWLVPFFANAKYIEPSPDRLWSGTQGGGLMEDLFSFVGPAGSLPIIWFLLITAILGLAAWNRERPKLARAYGAGLIAWTFAAYLGGYISALDPIQPRRFLVYVIALAVLPAVRGTAWLWERAGRRVGTGGAILACAVILLSPSAYMRVLPFKIMTDVPAELMTVADVIQKELRPQTRVMVEDTAGTDEGIIPYMGGHFPPLIPIITGRETLSGFMARFGIMHNRLMPRDGYLMGKPVEKVGTKELEDFLDLYNVGGILCFSIAAKTRFDGAAPLIVKRKDFGRLSWYLVDRAGDYIIGGSGKVTATVNKIEVSDLISEQEFVILKYHWMDNFKSDPPLKLEQVLIGGDPVGFIKVHNPPASFIIYNAY